MRSFVSLCFFVVLMISSALQWRSIKTSDAEHLKISNVLRGKDGLKCKCTGNLLMQRCKIYTEIFSLNCKD